MLISTSGGARHNTECLIRLTYQCNVVKDSAIGYCEQEFGGGGRGSGSERGCLAAVPLPNPFPNRLNDLIL